MHVLDWCLVVLIPALVIFDGVRHGKGAQNSLEDYFLAGRRVRWWAMGMSVMATQASAITMISIAGHGYEHGLRWLHIYLALPFAMVLLCATVVPWFLRARVFTAYEYLERRFDGTARTLASILFLVSRGLAVGTSLYAPSVVLSVVVGLPQWIGILLMGGLSSAYTVWGGNAAVIFTDVKQMAVMIVGILVSLFIAVQSLPADVGFGDAMALAGAFRKLEAIHIAPNAEQVFADKYNLLSALLGGFFLFLGYFGADQSQVQRYLAGSSVNQSRISLMVSAFAKVPMQFLILLLGTMIYVHYTFAPAPVFFREDALAQRLSDAAAAPDPALAQEYSRLKDRHALASQERRDAAVAFLKARDSEEESSEAARRLRESGARVAEVKGQGIELYRRTTGDRKDDGDFIFPFFFVNELPVGLLGLVIAAIFVAAMSSLDAQLNSLATSSVMDLYVRAFRQPVPPARVLRMSRFATVFWGAFATASAFFVGNLGPIIEVVNKIGSMFYGSLFGVFLLGWLCPRARGSLGWISLLCGFLCVMYVHFVVNAKEVIIDGRKCVRVEFLWYNLIGCLGVLLIGFALAYAKDGLRLWRARSPSRREP